jgi:hypothetical protein
MLDTMDDRFRKSPPPPIYVAPTVAAPPVSPEDEAARIKKRIRAKWELDAPVSAGIALRQPVARVARFSGLGDRSKRFGDYVSALRYFDDFEKQIKRTPPFCPSMGMLPQFTDKHLGKSYPVHAN